MSDAQVVIVGGGPVGLMNALGLAQAGVEVTLIEAEASIVDSPRAMVYAWPVLDGLEMMGLLEDMLTVGFPVHKICWRVLKTGEDIEYDYDSLKGRVPRPFGLTLGQNKLAEIVLKHLSNYPHVKILWSTKFTSLSQSNDGVRVEAEQADGQQVILNADWVIGADGARSGVRKAIGQSLEGKTWPDRFVAVNILFDFDALGYKSGYIIDSQHGAVLAKVTREGLWRYTFSESAELPLETVRERIDAAVRRVIGFDDAEYEIMLFSAYNMHQRSAGTYRVGRVLLAGDSAHITNPTSGFGLMGGMYDTFLLIETLAAVIAGDASPSLLDAYSDARRNVYHKVTSPVSSESMRLVFHSDDPERLEQDLQSLRARRSDPDAMRAFLSIPRALETPSLITNKTLQERLDEATKSPRAVTIA